jgi:RNA polymerase sigma-70 factor, ECF subfamily
VKPEDDPDVQLMLAVKRDDMNAFETLFRKHAASLVGLASPFVQSRARAEEIAQETFLQVYKTRHRYEPRARFVTWLYRIATNLCLSEARRPEHRFAARQPAPPEGEDEGNIFDSFRDPVGRTGEEDLLAREEMLLMKEALRELPVQQRAAVLLARVEGLSYDDVARTLDCSVSAVKSLIHRATVTLRGRFADTGQGKR